MKKLKKPVVFNAECFAVQVKENDQGVIIDVFVRHGELIDSFTFWNMDFFPGDKK